MRATGILRLALVPVLGAFILFGLGVTSATHAQELRYALGVHGLRLAACRAAQGLVQYFAGVCRAVDVPGVRPNDDGSRSHVLAAYRRRSLRPPVHLAQRTGVRERFPGEESRRRGEYVDRRHRGQRFAFIQARPDRAERSIHCRRHRVPEVYPRGVGSDLAGAGGRTGPDGRAGYGGNHGGRGTWRSRSTRGWASIAAPPISSWWTSGSAGTYRWAN